VATVEQATAAADLVAGAIDSAVVSAASAPVSEEDAAAVLLQSAMRGQQIRKDLAAQGEAAIAVQAAMRGKKARKGMATQTDDAAAVILQAAMRGGLVDDEASLATETVTTAVQSAVVQADGETDKAAVAIQAAIRGKGARSKKATGTLTAAEAAKAEVTANVSSQAMAELVDSYGEEQAAVILQAAMRGRATRAGVAGMAKGEASAPRAIADDMAAAKSNEQAATILQAAMRGRKARLEVASKKDVDEPEQKTPLAAVGDGLKKVGGSIKDLSDNVGSGLGEGVKQVGGFIRRISTGVADDDDKVADEGEAPLVEGSLIKQGTGFPYLWQRRYCQFFASTKTLVYYATAEDAKAGVRVRGQKSVTKGIVKYDKELHGLSFDIGEGKMLLAKANTRDEQQQWLSVVGKFFASM